MNVRCSAAYACEIPPEQCAHKEDHEPYILSRERCDDTIRCWKTDWDVKCVPVEDDNG